MSFNREVARARDRSLPYGERVLSFAHSLDIYAPLGFQATWAFLERLEGNLRRDEDALSRALDRLEHSRRLCLAEEHAYDEYRRWQKRHTVSVRPPRELTPGDLMRWHAAPVEGATFYLQWWWRTRRPGPAEDDLTRAVSDLVVSFLMQGTLDVDQQCAVRAYRAELATRTRRAAAASGFQSHATYIPARSLCHHLLLAHGQIVDGAAVPPWFTAQS